MSRFARLVALCYEDLCVARPQLTVITGGFSGGAAESAADEDEALVAAVVAGSAKAEEELYRRHARGVMLRVQRLLSSREDAQDALQDTFESAFREIKTLREPRALSAWLLRIAVHQAHRRLRRERLTRLFGLSRSTSDDEWLAAQARTDLTAEARVELHLVGRALRTLDANERIAWTLRYVEDLSLDEVAEACACSLATAKRRIAVAERCVEHHFAKESS